MPRPMNKHSEYNTPYTGGMFIMRFLGCLLFGEGFKPTKMQVFGYTGRLKHKEAPNPFDWIEVGLRMAGPSCREGRSHVSRNHSIHGIRFHMKDQTYTKEAPHKHQNPLSPCPPAQVAIGSTEGGMAQRRTRRSDTPVITRVLC